MKAHPAKYLPLVLVILFGSSLALPAHADWYDGHRRHHGHAPAGWAYDRRLHHYVYAPAYVAVPPPAPTTIVITQSAPQPTVVYAAPAPVYAAPQPVYVSPGPPAYGINLGLHFFR
jgi:hypothetical protein